MSDTPHVNAFIHYYQPEPPRHITGKAREKYIKKRKFYTCNSDNGYNYVDYADVGSKNKADYVDYSGDEEKSKGLFSFHGKLTKKEKRELKEQLRTTKSIVWDLVISFKPEWGQKYCADYEQAYEIFKSVLPRFYKRCGFKPDNMVTYFSLHTSTKHKHAHISFFEKEPLRYKSRGKELHYSDGHITKACLQFLKVITEQKASDISAELKVLRKELTQSQKQAIDKQLGAKHFQTEFRQGLADLMNDLPKTGRLGYDSDNMASVRPKIDKLVDCLIKSNKSAFKAFNEFNNALISKDIKTREMLKHNKIDEKYWAQYLIADKYLDDIYRRLGNQIINSVRVFRKEDIEARSQIARKRIQQAREQRLLDYSIKLQTSLETDAILAFNEYMNQLEKDKENLHEKN